MKKILSVMIIIVFLVICYGCKSNNSNIDDDPNIDNAIKQIAITSYSANNYTAQILKIDAINLGAYYFDGTNSYSFFSNKSVKGQMGSTSYNGVTLYTNGTAYFDAFGNQFPSWFVGKYDFIDTKYLICAENSSLYTYLSGKEHISKNLAILKINVLRKSGVNNSFNDSYAYIVQLNGDVEYVARNVFKDLNSIYNSAEYLIDSDSLINKVNDTTYIVSDSNNKYKYKYTYEPSLSSTSGYYDMNVKKQQISLNSNVDEYSTIMSLDFNGNKNLIEYKSKIVSNDSIDFTYIKDGVKYKLFMANGSNDTIEIDYLPVDYVMSRDKTYCYILCNKISKDKTISDEYYSFTLLNNLIMSEMTDNISMFDKYTYFNNSCSVLPENTSLIALNKYTMITKTNNSYFFNNIKGEPSGRYFSYEAGNFINNFSINNKYLFNNINNSANRIIAYDYLNNSFFAYEYDSLIFENYCVYKKNNKVMFFDEVLLDTNENVQRYSRNVIIFGEKTTFSCIVFYENGIKFLMLIKLL
ncbi:MAG: hypothetical protein IJ966_00610 [Bacilli bacterium]|nr:hypothetical protein [Bacilli bacterium]